MFICDQEGRVGQVGQVGQEDQERQTVLPGVRAVLEGLGVPEVWIQLSVEQPPLLQFE